MPMLPTGLQRHRSCGTYYLRRRIPTDLLVCYPGKMEVVFSLRTKDYRTYGPYGETLKADGKLPDMRYAGMLQHAATGLYATHYRFYDPSSARWLNRDPIGEESGANLYAYVGGNPLSYVDPDGLNPLAGAYAGAGMGSAFGPVGTVVGGLIGAGVGAWLGWNVVGPMFATPPSNAYDPNGPKAPGKPTEDDGFIGPKGGDNWVPNPNGKGWGWEDYKGDVWCPTGQGGSAHGGPHWDVQTPGGGYRNVRPKR